MISEVLINGEVSQGLIPVTDSSVLRGDGCFEVLKAYGGRPFDLEGHLDRLERSARAMDIALPSRDDLTSWINQIAESLGDCAVRVVVTRGSSVPGVEGGPLVVVFGHEWELESETVTLFPLAAPWHSAGVDWDLAGAKVLSYAPNVAATRHAKKEGFDDALLLTVDERVLEGPTFCVAWVIDGELETPGLELGILDSITRRVVLDQARALGVEVVEGVWPLQRLLAASEVMALSTIREVQPVNAVGDTSYETGPLTRRLRDSFTKLTSEGEPLPRG